ncbi:hypothetical protein H6P81_009643 [Aristolochia fimbriata]|uniref:Transmembrane protein 53 n=1 Tax=Aristolochia fimbriata TaxID=158543 RepID=A0AAV7ELH2_ARIFI|nr:hypothetical protein H6P81_009643 [Aristolochia fimbriata]
MEVSLRILSTSTQLNRCLPVSLLSGCSLRTMPNLSYAGNHFPVHLFSRDNSVEFPSILCPSSSLGIARSSLSSHKSNPLGFPFSLSATHFSTPSSTDGYSEFPVSMSEEGLFDSAASSGLPCSNNIGDQGLSAAKSPVLTAVLLGWLGAEKKHLRRYAELYNSNGIRTIPFVINVKEIMSPDMGRGAERRIAKLAEELMSWLHGKEIDGRERGLLFHTFSNTGWLAYGVLLDNLQQKGDFMQKIKGCVVDSGGDPEINPQVWAAGFSAALLKKRSSLMHCEANAADNKPRFVEKFLLNSFEMLFSILLMMPEVNRRLRKIIGVLSDKQPPCPQLYLYSTADKVIPYRSVESFIEQQKKSGKEIMASNFETSPHVDHLRSFPSIYSKRISEFLMKCTSTVDVTN